MEDIDVRVIIKKLLSKWYWFALSLFISLGVAALYIATTAKEYLVETSLQLKDQNLGDKGTSQGKFISGYELLESNSELADEIGVLTSYSTIWQSLEELGLEVSYFQYPKLFGVSGKYLANEIYPAPFKISFDNTSAHVMNTPVHITFLNKNQYRLQIAKTSASIKDPLYLYNFKSHASINRKKPVELDTILSIGQPFQTSFLSFKLNSVEPEVWENNMSYLFKINSLNDITETYRQKLYTAQISEESNIVNLSLKTAAPQKDIEFLNALNKVYITNELQKKNHLGLKTIGFIDNQLEEVSAALQKAETNLKSFRSKSNIIDVELTSPNLTNQLYALEDKQAQLKIQNKFYIEMSDYLKRNRDVSEIIAPSSVGIQDPSLNNLLIQLAALNERKIAIEYNSSKFNPVLSVVENKIQSTKKSLLDNINNLVSSNKIALQETNRRVNEIKQTINRLPENERSLVNINRGFKFNDNIYNYLLQKRAEAGIALASNIPDKSVVDAPRQIGYDPIGPNKMFIFLIALVIGFIAPAGIIFTKDFFQPKLENENQLRFWTDIPLLERIAQLKGKEKNTPYAGQSYIAHTFRYIRQHIDVHQLNREVKAIGVTSATSGEGKTFCAMHLAQSFARAGRKTLLVDADLYQPDMERYFKVNTKPGLSDFLMCGESQIVQPTDINKLDIVTSGTPTDDPSDLLTKNYLDSLLKKWREQYDIIIFDTPPVGLIADYFAFSKHIDFTLLVVRHKYSEKEHIKRVSKIINDNLLPAGIVYNGAPVTNNYAGYYQDRYRNRSEKV